MADPEIIKYVSMKTGLGLKFLSKDGLWDRIKLGTDSINYARHFCM